MSAPVAMIPYVNMAPYRQLGPPAGCHFVPLAPKASIAALMAGEVVAAAVPVGGLTALADIVETVGRFGIAARGPCMSVLFFSKVPLGAMHFPRTIRITAESATSVRLLYLLLGQRHGFERLPCLVSGGGAADGELLIGDRALVKGQRAAVAPYLHVADLSQLWFDIHGLPFVFARWVVRTDAPDGVRAAIAGWLDRFQTRESEMVEQAVPEATDTLGLAAPVIRRYFRAIRRCLDESDIRGQRRFARLFEAQGRRPLFSECLEKGPRRGDNQTLRSVR